MDSAAFFKELPTAVLDETLENEAKKRVKVGAIALSNSLSSLGHNCGASHVVLPRGSAGM